MLCHMEQLGKSLKPKELKVSLVFDEMAIRRHLDYNRALDCINGLTTKGEVANQAMVLMARGVASRWKQVSRNIIPYCYKKGYILWERHIVNADLFGKDLESRHINIAYTSSAHFRP